MATGTRTPRIFTWPWVVIPFGVAVAIALGIGAGIVLLMTPGNSDTITASPSIEQPAAPAVQQPVAPAQQATASESAPSVTAKGFTSGRYNLSQIIASSSNVVVALFGAARENIPVGETLQYTDRDALVENEKGFYPYARLKKVVQDRDHKSFLVIGSLRNPTNGEFLNSKEAVPDINYPVSVLFAEYGDRITYWVWRMDFLLYKTSSDEWRIRNFSPTVSPNSTSDGPNGWDGDAFKKALARSNNEPFNLYR